MKSTEHEGKSFAQNDLQRQVFFFFGEQKRCMKGMNMVSVKTSFLFQSRYEKFYIHFKVIIYDVSENK